MLERNLKHARHEGAIGRAKAVPANGSGEMKETMVLRAHLPCPRTFGHAFGAIWCFGNTPMRVRLMEAYEALAGMA
jgi:hypothetical protein